MPSIRKDKNFLIHTPEIMADTISVDKETNARVQILLQKNIKRPSHSLELEKHLPENFVPTAK